MAKMPEISGLFCDVLPRIHHSKNALFWTLIRSTPFIELICHTWRPSVIIVNGKDAEKKADRLVYPASLCLNNPEVKHVYVCLTARSGRVPCTGIGNLGRWSKLAYVQLHQSSRIQFNPDESS